jgi:hypothetical protein
MRVAVKDERVVEEVNRQSGDIYRQQWCFFTVDGIEKPFKVGLGMNGKPYKVGEYELSPESFMVDQYDKLRLRFPDLVPVASAVGVRKSG